MYRTLTRTRTEDPGHVELDDVTSGRVSSDGRLKIRFHDNSQKLSQWVQRMQTSLKRRNTCGSNLSSDSSSTPKEKPNVSAIPRLNIAIHIVGSRGDVQPFIPIAQLLSRAPFNHRVRICTHPVFKDFVEGQGIEFFSIGGDPEALMAYMVKNPGLLPNRESVKAGDIGKRREEMWEIINGAWRSCIEAGNGMGPPVKAATVTDPAELFVADLIIANPPSMAHIHCAEKLGIPLHMVFTMPWSPTELFSHPLASMSYGGADAKTANYLSFVMMEMLTWQGLGDLISKFRYQKLGLDPISPLWGFQLLTRMHVPFTYLWSKSLIPKPADWASHINITGFSFLPLASSYTPPDDLTAFLEMGPAPIYIGFGSIVVDDPAALTTLIFKAVEMAGVRAIISKGWSGVGGENVPENIYLIGNCPHDWLFQRVSAVVHHGGAGTTAAGIAAGRPTVVVPFFGDQPFWGQMVARAGAGPIPVPFKEMTAETLAESIKFALKPEVAEGAKKMAENIALEDGADDTVRITLEQLVEEYQLQCEICPERVAVWKHRKTGRRLSGFAVCCLIDRGICAPNDFKLLQHKRWYVDEGAEHPLIGAIGSVTGFFTSVATATSDYSHALKTRPRRASVAAGIKPDSDSSAPTITEPKSADIATPKSPVPSDGLLKSVITPQGYTPHEMEAVAMKLAKKSLSSVDPQSTLVRRPTLHDKGKQAWHLKEQGRHGQQYYRARATGRYAGALGKAALKAPVAFFWNTANGFHNFPSYGFAGIEVRKRDPITGFGSGVKSAGKEFGLGMWEAFSGVVVQPYKSTKAEGAKGLGKGIWRAGKGFFFNFGAAVWGLPGYTLKGVERELSKRHLTKLKAEIILVRMRQAITDFRDATDEQKDDIEVKWKAFL